MGATCETHEGKEIAPVVQANVCRALEPSRLESERQKYGIKQIDKSQITTVKRLRFESEPFVRASR